MRTPPKRGARTRSPSLACRRPLPARRRWRCPRCSSMMNRNASPLVSGRLRADLESASSIGFPTTSSGRPTSRPRQSKCRRSRWMTGATRQHRQEKSTWTRRAIASGLCTSPAAKNPSTKSAHDEERCPRDGHDQKIANHRFTQRPGDLSSRILDQKETGTSADRLRDEL